VSYMPRPHTERVGWQTGAAGVGCPMAAAATATAWLAGYRNGFAWLGWGLDALAVARLGHCRADLLG
jgi:ribosome modulation factor